MRESGILYPISTLPSKFGIGCFSPEAYEFVDFLAKATQGYWQILPMGPTGYGDSPYQSVSAFAGNPYFISPEKLIEDGLLTWEECYSYDFGSDEEKVDYGALYNNRFLLLRQAYDRFTEQGRDKTEEYAAFSERNSYWLEDYCLFMAIKNAHQGAGWQTWEKPLRVREKAALKEAAKEYKDTIEFYRFQQYMFEKQWQPLHAYATEKKVKIIGDIPFYAAMDSVDAWSHPEIFQMDEDSKPIVVAGCAPDVFSATGQRWGNPIYDWDKLAKDGYDWWMRRIERCFELMDVLRVDHFHGFAEYYAIPAEDETAENGVMKKGPGMDFFRALRARIGVLNGRRFRIIAEDLGTVTKENSKLLKDSGLPGMKVLQFAFTSWDSLYIPYRHEKNSVVYTGTHDNPTTMQWLAEITDGERDFVRRYVNAPNSDYGALTWDLIRECYRSVAELCVVPIQDYLVKGKEARMNCPGEVGSNWQWRIRPGYLSDELAQSIHNLTVLYGRIPKGVEEIGPDSETEE